MFALLKEMTCMDILFMLLTCGTQAMHANVQLSVHVVGTVELSPLLANVPLHPFHCCIPVHNGLFLSAKGRMGPGEGGSPDCLGLLFSCRL